MKWVELVEEHVRKIKVVRKIPLSYLIRTAYVSAPVISFPAGHAMPYVAEYEAFHDEMMVHILIFAFIIKDLTSEKQLWRLLIRT